MLIRTIESKDAEDFLELSKAIEQSGYMLFAPGEKQMTVEQQRQSIERILAEERSMILVAESEGELIGFIAAFGGNLKRNKHNAYLVIGVLETHQGKGVATQLFQQLFEWAKERGIVRLELTVIKDNVKAFNLYEKMGFLVEGEKVHSLIIDGVPVNEYYLYKLM